MAALLQISKFEGLRTLYVKNCEWSDSSESKTLAFQALGTRCPHLTAIHFINVGVSIEDAASLLSHCSTIRTLEMTDIGHYRFQIPPLDHLTSLESLTLSSNSHGQALPPLHTLTRLTTLVLTSHLVLPSLPPIHTLSLLQSLDLRECVQLQTLPPLSGSPFLQHLNVSDCYTLKEVDVTYSPLLESLIVTGCTRLREIAGLESLTSLHTLKACRCDHLTPWPKLSSIHSLQNVAFDVQHSHQIQRLDTMPWLRHLCLSVRTSQVSLESLYAIEDLSLKLVHLDALPSLACFFHGLRTLEIHQCRMRLMDMDEIEHMSTLQRLDISHTVISRLPKLTHLTQLQSIVIVRCDLIEEVPLLNTLANLTKLEVALCSKLKALPTLQGALNLCRLDLHICNLLVSLPSMAQLDRLTHLSVSGCTRLNSLPTLPHSLQTLDFKRCKSLAELPSLDSLVHLQHLLGRDSGIKNLPPLSGLISLRKLLLQHCKNLVVVPKIGGILSMRVLDVSQCAKLEQLPPLGTLRRLRLVRFFGCPRLTNLQFLEGVCEKVDMVKHQLPPR